MIKKLRFKSIKGVILLQGFALISLICLIVLLISSTLTQKAFNTQLEADMEVIADQVSNKLMSKIVTTEEIVQAFSTSPMLSDKEFTHDDVVKFFEARAAEEGFSLFFKVDKNGKGVNLTKGGETFDVADTEYFKQSIQGKTYTSSIIDDVVTGEKIMVVSTPYYDTYNGELLGVFAGIKSTDFIAKMCAEFKWGTSGNVAVYDKETKVIGHANMSLFTEGGE